MSSLAGWASLALLALTGGMAPQGRESPEAARYRIIVDSLTREWRAARTAEQRRDSAATAGVGIDSARVGPLTVLANVEHLTIAVEGSRIAWERVRPLIGSDSLLLAGRYYLRQAASPQSGRLARDVRRFVYDPKSTPEEVAVGLVNQLGQDLMAASDPALRRWLGPAVPLSHLGPAGLGRAYREVVTHRTPGAPQCVAGDLSACADALELRSEPQASATPTARRALAELALELGGEGGYRRFVTAAVPDMATRLAITAGVPVDSLLAEWHARLTGARPQSTEVPLRAAGAALFWVAVFGLAATRSSRWRFA